MSVNNNREFTESEALTFAFSDLFWPKQLPQSQNTELFRITNEFSTYLKHNHPEISRNIVFFLNPSEHTACAIHKALLASTSSQIVFVYVAKQNAAIYFHRFDETEFQISSFHVTCPARDVYQPNQIVIKIPTRTIQVDIQQITHVWLEQLITLSTHVMDSAMQHSRKAGAVHQEDRDVANPRFIHEFLLGVLNGKAIECTSSITKKVRDTVLWNNADLPYRRSGAWLAMKAALHVRYPQQYKSIMIHFMCVFLRKYSGTRALNDEQIFQCVVKISRRMKKCSNDTLNWLTAYQQNECKDILRQSTEQMQVRWNNVMDAEKAELNIINDEHYSMQHPYPKLFESSEQKGSVCKYQTPIKSVWKLGDSIDKSVLYEVEQWVTSQMMSNQNSNVTISRLSHVLNGYIAVASGYYAQDPYHYSRMLLTVLTIVVLMHRKAIDWDTKKLLRKYSFPTNIAPIFEHLLLRQLKEINQAISVKKYVDSFESFRHSFDETAKENTLDVEYTKNDESLKALLARIHRKYQKEKQHKLKEIERTKREYQSLQEEIRRLKAQSCECGGYYDWQHRYHSTTCYRCQEKQRKEKQSRQMKIKVHEKYLPETSYKQYAIAFELETPSPLQHLRNAICKFQQLICDRQHTGRISVKKEWKSILQGRGVTFAGSGSNILSLGSNIKLVSQSHYANKHI
eukprot:776117_1